MFQVEQTSRTGNQQTRNKPTSGKDDEVSNQRVSGVISILMEEPHHGKIQTAYNSDHQRLHLEEYDILGIDLDKIIKPEKNDERCQQMRKLSDINSNLRDVPHLNKKQTLHPSNDLSMHKKEESNKLGINLNIPTSQGNIVLNLDCTIPRGIVGKVLVELGLNEQVPKVEKESNCDYSELSIFKINKV